MKYLKIFVVAGILISVFLSTASAQTRYRSLKQPDGTTFEAVERGDEWLRFYETPEGYIVRPSADRYFRYFNIDARGEFVATDSKVGIDAPRNIPVRPYENPAVRRALQEKIDVYNAAADANRKRYLQWQRRRLASANALGKRSTSSPSLSMASDTTLTVGVLLVEFNGRPHDASD